MFRNFQNFNIKLDYVSLFPFNQKSTIMYLALMVQKLLNSMYFTVSTTIHIDTLNKNATHEFHILAITLLLINSATNHSSSIVDRSMSHLSLERKTITISNKLEYLFITYLDAIQTIQYRSVTLLLRL